MGKGFTYGCAGDIFCQNTAAAAAATAGSRKQMMILMSAPSREVLIAKRAHCCPLPVPHVCRVLGTFFFVLSKSQYLKSSNA